MITTTCQPTPTPQPVRFTVQDYHRLLELGFLREDDHIELIRGELVRMAAKGTAHESCLRRLLRILPKIVGDRATLQCQSPITIAFDGEPEPDVAIVKNQEDDYASAHPTPADTLLVIEVADSSLEYDRTVKLSLYAEAKIPYYWLFNVSDRTLEVYSEPAEITPRQFGYLSKRIIPTSGVVQLPQFPEQVLELASIFPNSSQ
ncbi:Uma2 family endonuclease [Thermosynechococcus sp. JY1334]|uniref:Uma2 family endonuclease n=1 Tax=unclassified Thermosynechococcus TaxID=2622553 RepID=UPI0026735E16|nr:MULTISPECIES: Uma2 family endonuclease [unclassified Thermosynechococcus]MDR5639068.1 Uma2 family endonuclease [Thermosynechococcus sp. PP42]MDR7898161.1 Uma2 family endonuclease [Thermosynechococcus sp. JY1332]MDR7905562.1 Uma2 family endonuclease [Thermosynechococcus sp. JY1334]MDR7993394.1 Uma2 family endonuclease [Thermosynechococcus sp. TG252]WKT80327.1 Uma2 family endonuclease [Thermosynechococcus sp. PP45]